MKRTPPASCPSCGKCCDAATLIEGENQQPEPGDLSVCAYCGTFLQFGPKLELVALSLEEMVALPDDVRITLQRTRRDLERMREES